MMMTRVDVTGIKVTAQVLQRQRACCDQKQQVAPGGKPPRPRRLDCRQPEGAMDARIRLISTFI
jgi:hypothetical protein